MDGGEGSISMQEPFISSDVMTDLFYATYHKLVLLPKAWKLHGSLRYVVVNILIELATSTSIASNSARYTGGKLAIGCHPDTCPISKSGT